MVSCVDVASVAGVASEVSKSCKFISRVKNVINSGKCQHSRSAAAAIAEAVSQFPLLKHEPKH